MKGSPGKSSRGVSEMIYRETLGLPRLEASKVKRGIEEMKGAPGKSPLHIEWWFTGRLSVFLASRLQKSNEA